MYLRSLAFENVKLLADATISFEREGGARQWTVLLGDNGVCKTTILQAIALAASGDKLARALVGNAADYISADSPESGARIHAVFAPSCATGDDADRLAVTMEVAPGRSDFNGVGAAAARVNEVRGSRRAGFFVVGYGVGRYLPRPGEVAIPSDPARDRVEGVFDTRHKMLGIDFFEALEKRELGRAFAARVRDVLVAEDPSTREALLPWLADVELRGQGGLDAMERLLKSRRFALDIGGRKLKLPPTALSQGYQSIVAWITDLLGHAFLESGGDVSPGELEGIVLLDEIDIHLHPTWQRRIIPILRRVFPKLQFIVTTHSPLVLTGFEADEVIELVMRDGYVHADAVVVEPAAQSASQLLTRYFDVPVAARPEIARKESRYLELKAKSSRSTEEQSELDALEAELTPYFASPARDPRGDEVEIAGSTVAALPLDERVRRMEAKIRKMGGA